MKKMIALLLVLGLVCACAFAGFKVGFQFGYGGTALNATNGSNKINIGNGGWYAAAVGEYILTEGFTAKLELGANGFVRDSYKGVFNGTTKSHVVVEGTVPVHVTAYTGVQFAFDLFGDIQLAVGAGADVMIGKDGSSTDDKPNIAFGPAGELAFLFRNFGNDIMLFIGGKTAWYLVNSDKTIGTGYEGGALGTDPAISYMAYRFFAGMTYEF